MTERCLRTFEVRLGGRIETINASYWQVGGATTVGGRREAENFVLFKDVDGQPVYAARSDLVESICEVYAIAEPMDR